MKNLKQTKQFLFRVFLAGLFLFLYTSAASANPLSAQDGISDGREKASATLIKWTAYQGLDEGELSSGIWQFCGRAELGALPGETYYDGALYVETLGDRSGGFVFEGARTAGLAHHPDGPLKPLCGLYGGKERMRDGSLNDYDFSARRLNSALALWTAPDPMARDFSSINPYVYCASNPIRYIDPTGCVFTDAAKSVVDYYRININKRIEKEQKNIDKKTKKGDTKIEKNQRKIEELNGILDELKVLEESSTTYNVVEKNVEEQTIEWDNNRQEVLITLSDKENLVYISHEFLHAYQFETGLLDFLVDTNTKYKRILYDLTDEKAAHDRGRIFGGGDIYTNWSPSYDELEDVDYRLGPIINLAKTIKTGEKQQTIFKYNGKLYKPKSKL